MLAVSLFSGAGGFEIGFDRAGIQTVLQAESDPWCLQVLARQWPGVERVTDVREVNARSLSGGRRHLARAGRSANVECVRPQWRNEVDSPVDLIYGGFPCQDVSVAGQRAGLAGERSGLWSEFRRVLSELRPRWFCAENVPGLLSSAGGRDFLSILCDVDELGYGVAWAILDARYFGVPQRRRRVFIVGCLGNPDAAAQVLAVCESGCGDSPTRSEAREGVAFTLRGCSPDTSQRIGNGWNTNYVAATQSGGGHGYGVNLPGRHHEDGENLVAFGGNNTSGPITVASSRSSRASRYDFDTDTFLVADTVRSHPRPGSNSSRQSGRVRRLTPRECERLMGWPDDWTRWTADGREIPDSHRYRLCGNGVVATVAQWIGHRLVAVEAVA